MRAKRLQKPVPQEVINDVVHILLRTPKPVKSADLAREIRKHLSFSESDACYAMEVPCNAGYIDGHYQGGVFSLVVTKVPPGVDGDLTIRTKASAEPELPEPFPMVVEWLDDCHAVFAAFRWDVPDDKRDAFEDALARIRGARDAPHLLHNQEEIMTRMARR